METPFFHGRDWMSSNAGWVFPLVDLPGNFWPALGRDPYPALKYFIELMRFHEPDTPMEAWLEPSRLTSSVTALWRAYRAQYASENLRVPVSAVNTPELDATLFRDVARVFVNRPSALAMEAILAVIFAVIAYLSLSLRNNKDLPKAPYSIAAQMSFLAGSKLVRLDRLKGAEAQRMSDAKLRAALHGYRLTLGRSVGPDGRWRFGIDFETAEEELRRENSEQSLRREAPMRKRTRGDGSSR